VCEGHDSPKGGEWIRRRSNQARPVRGVLNSLMETGQGTNTYGWGSPDSEKRANNELISPAGVWELGRLGGLRWDMGVLGQDYYPATRVSGV